ncbi:hypothetical protein ACXHXM_28705|nr:hypothetical protein [Rhizobium altiplani]
MQFKVWGKIDGVEFSQTYATVAEWKAERRLIEQRFTVEVKGMASV